MGNPNLLPEFGDSFEITGILLFEKWSLNSSVYYIFTSDVIERVTTFVDDVSFTMPINVGERRKAGFEMNGKYRATKWLTINGDFNYGIFNRTGQFEEQNFDFDGDQWSTRMNAKFKLPKKFDFEVTGAYRSRVVTIQGNNSGYASMDLGLRKRFWKGKLVSSLGVRDVFASRIRENIVDQQEFYTYSFSQRGRFITLGVSYSFGKGEAMQYTGRRYR